MPVYLRNFYLHQLRDAKKAEMEATKASTKSLKR